MNTDRERELESSLNRPGGGRSGPALLESANRVGAAALQDAPHHGVASRPAGLWHLDFTRAQLLYRFRSNETEMHRGRLRLGNYDLGLIARELVGWQLEVVDDPGPWRAQVYQHQRLQLSVGVARNAREWRHLAGRIRQDLPIALRAHYADYNLGQLSPERLPCFATIEHAPVSGLGASYVKGTLTPSLALMVADGGLQT